jgi:photosystem II stability/assembly factor-like uncharacterized protein
MLPSGHYLTSIFFLDTLNGWISGKDTGSPGNGVIFHTTNGGKTWISQIIFKIG